MPPRRSHTKSRFGCDQCKKRRVKCDEQGPPCSNCTSRELECTYLKAPVVRGIPNMSTSPLPVQMQNSEQFLEQSYQQVPDAFQAGPSKAAELRSLELMHKFSTETYQGLSNSPADFYIWQIIIPRKALDHDFLLGGIMAIASLHIASAMDPPGAHTYINAALEYYNQALVPYRQAIDNINPDNCDAVFAHSLITTIFSIALPQLMTKKDESPSMTDNITVVFELLQGVSKIRNMWRPWLKMKLFTSTKDFWDATDWKPDSDTETALDHLSTLTDQMRADVEQQRIVKDALTLLRRCFSRYNNTKDVASVIAWLASVNKDFVEALRCRQPLALIVLMYWGTLLHQLDGRMWWAKNSGSALVLELLAELHPHHSQWCSVFLWPKQKIGLQEPSAIVNDNMYKTPT